MFPLTNQSSISSSFVPPTPASSPTHSYQLPLISRITPSQDCSRALSPIPLSPSNSPSSSPVPCSTPGLCHGHSVTRNHSFSIGSSPAPSRPPGLFPVADYDDDQHINAESHSVGFPPPSSRRSVSPAASVVSDKLSSACSDDSDLDDLATLAFNFMNIPSCVSKDDAARLLLAATNKKRVLQAQRELAYSRLREARMQTKLCSWKAKHADNVLHIADIHVSRIRWVISKSGHQEILPTRGPAVERLPVYQDGSVYAVDTINGRLEVVLD